ncbi:uncharacterized protein LOC143075963 isoform X1 [Mytilus galloprovincialis]|uniref:uncharacterized protein LOC143075963 isoform X1 n=1 Tax=Mytilus galloprovincialis TaxID=29158 RepID=UPI003F7B6305
MSFSYEHPVLRKEDLLKEKKPAFQTQRTNLTHKATNPEYKYIERDAISYSVADRIEDTDELRLVLFGTKQSGKSSTGDMILGEAKFPSQCLTKSNISTNILHRTIRCGKSIKIVETPGFRISELAREDVKVNVVKNINTATQQLEEEPHAYLYIISSKTNLDQETKVIDLIYRRLRKLIDKMVIVFTGFDFLQPKGLSRFTYIESLPDKFKTFVADCNGESRIVFFDNSRLFNEALAHTQVSKLIKIVETLL